jgi:hypothetical protein
MKYPFSWGMMLHRLVFDSTSFETSALPQNNGNEVAGDTTSYCRRMDTSFKYLWCTAFWKLPVLLSSGKRETASVGP